MSNESGRRPRRHPSLPGDPHHRPHLLGEVMRTSQALVTLFSRQTGMPASRLALLRLLAIAHPDGLGVVRMAREVGIDAAAVTRSVRQLEEDGLVGIRPHPRDARRKLVGLTADGLQIARRLHVRGHQLEESLGADVSREDVATAVRVLGRLRAAVEAVRDDPFGGKAAFL